MKVKAEPSITAEQAASLIYETQSPTAIQVGEVTGLMRAGLLRPCEGGGFTTKRTAVADYLASREQRRLEAQRARWQGDGQERTRVAVEALPHRGSRLAADRKLRRLNRELLEDYFRAVVTRGRGHDHSPAFQRAVFATRCMLLLLLLGVAIWAVASIRGDSDDRIVRDWLEVNAPGARLVDLRPAHFRTGGKAVRVRYQPATAGADVADRVLLIRDGGVAAVVLPDEEDDKLARGR